MLTIAGGIILGVIGLQLIGAIASSISSHIDRSDRRHFLHERELSEDLERRRREQEVREHNEQERVRERDRRERERLERPERHARLEYIARECRARRLSQPQTLEEHKE
mgnify:CR=1 FL=1